MKKEKISTDTYNKLLIATKKPKIVELGGSIPIGHGWLYKNGVLTKVHID